MEYGWTWGTLEIRFLDYVNTVWIPVLNKVIVREWPIFLLKGHLWSPLVGLHQYIDFTEKIKFKFRHISVRYIIAYSDCILFRNSLNNWIFFLSSASFFFWASKREKSNIRIIFIQWGIIPSLYSNLVKNFAKK